MTNDEEEERKSFGSPNHSNGSDDDVRGGKDVLADLASLAVGARQT